MICHIKREKRRDTPALFLLLQRYKTIPGGSLPTSWNLQIPSLPEIVFGESSLTLSPAYLTDVEDLGGQTICLTISCACVFSGDIDRIPVTLCVDGTPVTPGMPAIYGTVSASGSSFLPITLVFGDGAWDALAAGEYSMEIYYNSYLASGE